MRLAIVTTHPIQYYAPVFKLLSQRKQLDIAVFYTWGESSMRKFDPGFKKKIEWDIPLLEGYPYEWLTNTSKDPGTHHFTGIVNPCLIERLNHWKPDALLIFGWNFSSHLKAIRFFKNKIPVYFRGDSTLLDERRGARTFLRKLFLTWVYRHIDHAFYTGINNKAYFKKFGLLESQLTFAPHAIDNKRFAATSLGEAAAIRKHLGISPGGVLVLFAGKLEEKKGPMQLLEAFLNLGSASVHLLYAGNGPLEERLKLKAGQNKNVHFMDFVNQSRMPVIYHACDLFCLPSNGPGETWGLAVNEAMACRRAILVSDKVGCAADLVVKNCNGLVFKAGDLGSLLSCLTYLSCNKAQLTKYGNQSAALIRNWNFLNTASAIEMIVLNEKRK